MKVLSFIPASIWVCLKDRKLPFSIFYGQELLWWRYSRQCKLWNSKKLKSLDDATNDSAADNRLGFITTTGIYQLTKKNAVKDLK